MFRRYILKRVLYGILMYVVMVFVYSALFINVADKTMRAQIEEQLNQEVRLQRNLSKDQLQSYLEQRRAQKIHQYHLNEPVPSRIFFLAVRTIKFDYGNATTMKAANGDRQVIGIILEALPRTIVLFTTEVVLTTLLGVALGLYMAQRPNGALDRFSSAVTMISNGLPSSWLGLIFIMALSYGVPLFPSGGLHVNPAPHGMAGVIDFLWHLSLPLLTLVILTVWGTAYLTRNIVLSNLQEDYVMAARARGVTERRVLFGHTLRTAMPAIMTLAVLGLFSSIAGNIIVEGIFGWPGIGNLYFVAVQTNDVPILTATLAIETLFNMVGFILLDIIYGLLDPRIKVGADMKAQTSDFLTGLRDFWREFSRVKTGLVGLAILIVFIVLAVIGPAIVPFPGATNHWRDINFWQDNSLASPPVWVNYLPWTARKSAVSALLPAPAVSTETYDNGTQMITYTFRYSYGYDLPPRDVVFTFQGEGLIPVQLSLTRPDGLVADLAHETLQVAKGTPQRLSITNDSGQSVIEFVRGQEAELASSLTSDLVQTMSILFSKMGSQVASAPVPLKGTYAFTVKALLVSGDMKLAVPTAIVSGRVAGVMGTDLSKRDIFTGIIVGIRWALIIGILTSIITVLVGVVLGVTAAYFGGAVDWLLNRLYEFIYLLPVLPFLIVISAIFKPSIWTLIIIICLFFWTGPYKPVYSMALQIREETYVEASRALGGRRLWIIFHHIIPILLPYSFAVMALAIPGVIVYEASVSLLGLGDATIVTWGQLLHDALGRGAVINRLWWWVIPPGLMIALMGMSFAFLGTALDKILHPKLKTR